MVKPNYCFFLELIEEILHTWFLSDFVATYCEMKKNVFLDDADLANDNDAIESRKSAAETLPAVSSEKPEITLSSEKPEITLLSEKPDLKPSK